MKTLTAFWATIGGVLVFGLGITQIALIGSQVEKAPWYIMLPLIFGLMLFLFGGIALFALGFYIASKESKQ